MNLILLFMIAVATALSVSVRITAFDPRPCRAYARERNSGGCTSRPIGDDW
jgi:hypothetical protein